MPNKPKRSSATKSVPQTDAAPRTAETHQTVSSLADTLTTNHGLPIADNLNSLKVGERGPTLLEDFILREKITHFDHERIPERIVHARGTGAHGYFEVYESLSDLTKAAFLQDPKVKTEVLARFSTVAGGAPRENPTRGFSSHPEPLDASKQRKRSETFADHYSQARMLFRSLTEPEQRHMVSAFAFELAKVETKAIRLRMLGHLANIDASLHDQVAAALGMPEKAETIKPAVAPRDLPPSPALSLIGKAPATLLGRKIGVLVTDGFDAELLTALQRGAKSQKAALVVIAPKVGGAMNSAGELVEADFPVSAAPSVFFDTVVILASKKAATDLATQAAAVDWVSDAFAHLKVLAYTPGAQPLLDRAGVKPDAGIIPLASEKAVAKYIATARNGRIWDREPSLRRPG